jgi:hypothetical protein
MAMARKICFEVLQWHERRHEVFITTFLYHRVMRKVSTLFNHTSDEWRDEVFIKSI